MNLRPHHLFCIQHFVGKGYDDAFTKNMIRVCSSLQADPDQRITLVFSADDLCACCPHLQEGGVCDAEEKVRRFDQNVISLLHLEEKPYHYSTLLTQIRTLLHRQALRQICTGCAWLKNGTCG